MNLLCATCFVRPALARGQKLTRTRWWIPIRLLRLICDTNQLDCSGLDDQASPPLEWVMSLVDDRGRGN
eukprot:1633574-Amphidinium_carterae.1